MTEIFDTKLFDLTYHLEINSYLLDYESYQDMLFDEKAKRCLAVYEDYVDKAMSKDSYLIPDYFNQEKEKVKEILKKEEK